MQNTQEKELNAIKRYIRQVLKQAGVHDGTLGYQIETVATSVVVFRKMRRELMALDSMTILEYSDKGQERIKTHPLLAAIREQSKLIIIGLDKLTMNIKSKKVKAEVEDGFTRFMEEMNREDD